MVDMPYHLTTPRLVLRSLQLEDAAALCGYRSQPEVARFQGWESFGWEDAIKLIEDRSNREAGVPGQWLQLAIVEAATQTMIGDCGLHCLADDPRQFKVGITLSTSHQGLGYATETMRGVLDYLFGTWGAHRVFAEVDAENERSAALFRRLGFRQEAHHVENIWFKGKWGGELVFALLRREWEMTEA
jgi:RimJ/RimL family protein N-acetyltransferase